MADNSNTKKWVVGIHQYPARPGQTIGKIVKMNDPCTGVIRDYGIMSSVDGSGSYIAEFQNIPEDFSSFIVGRHILKDGDIYLINRIDPLFFYIQTQAIDYQQQEDGDKNIRLKPKKQSWQPYDQVLEQSELPHEITSFISEEQIKHVCSTFENEELYFKFNLKKAMQWLQKKQERVFMSLLRRDQRNRKANEKCPLVRGNDAEGSISANFNSYEPSSVAVHRQEILQIESKSDMKALKIESLQLVCAYLNETWSKKLIEHFGYTVDEIKSRAKMNYKSPLVSINNGTKRKDSGTIDSREDSLTKKTVANPKSVAAARTAGNKRLATLSTKGMRSIGSFFTQGKTKKAKR